MKEQILEFLSKRQPIPGLAAWSARLPDRTLASESFADWLKPAQVEQVLSRLLIAAEALNQHRLQPRRLCWTFDHLRIHLGFRSDGACLACFAENRPGQSAPELDDLLGDFGKSLP